MAISLLHSSLPLLLVFALSVSAFTRLSLKVGGPTSAGAVDDLHVLTTLRNTGDEILKILNDPLSPVSKLPANTFNISHESGFTPSFIGIKVKYSPEGAAEIGDYTILSPNESIEVKHNLAEAYDFTRSGEGRYIIAPRNIFYIVDSVTSRVRTIQATIDRTHTAKLSGRLRSIRPTRKTPGEIFSGCSSIQEADLKSAALAAQGYAAAASHYLQAHTTGTPRFSTWFGSYASARHETVHSHFSSISSHNFSSFTYDCSCTEKGTYAYVYPSEFGEIYLCGAFWKAPLEGTDSKAGTLIHESSHFNLNGGTEDIVYGQAGCKSLAIKYPTLAINNADSHEYFAENNPALN